MARRSPVAFSSKSRNPVAGTVDPADAVPLYRWRASGRSPTQVRRDTAMAATGLRKDAYNGALIQLEEKGLISRLHTGRAKMFVLHEIPQEAPSDDDRKPDDGRRTRPAGSRQTRSPEERSPRFSDDRETRPSIGTEPPQRTLNEEHGPLELARGGTSTRPARLYPPSLKARRSHQEATRKAQREGLSRRGRH